MICYPLKSKKFNSISNIKKFIIGIWVMALLLSIPLVKFSAVSWNVGYLFIVNNK